MMKRLKFAILAVLCASSMVMGEHASAETLSPDGESKSTPQQQTSTDAASALAELLSRYQSLPPTSSSTHSPRRVPMRSAPAGVLCLKGPTALTGTPVPPMSSESSSDGQYIWIHDIDLEQVTRKSAAAGGGSAPALILNGDVAALKQRFVIELLEQEGERAIYQLLPRDEEGNFVRIQLLFKAGVLGELLLEDSLGQRTTILLDGIRLNPEVKADRFEFEPPPGVDVILDAGV